MSCKLRRGGVLIAAVAVSTACASARRPLVRPAPVATGTVGGCADPRHDGVVSDAPRLARDDRDLDGDGHPETVVTDRRACTADGNCYWNVFVQAPRRGCLRWAGTFAGAALETVAETGDRGFRSVRAWWRLTGGGRLLMQEYRYRRGSYRPVGSLLCRRHGATRIECAPPLRYDGGGVP